MPKDLKPTDPKQFGLTSFADLLAPRSSIPGQDPDTFEAVRAGIFASLAPVTPYECLIAENLVAIDWELLQHRRMRGDLLRQSVVSDVTKAAIDFKWKEYEVHWNADWKRHEEAGGTEDTWTEPPEFDEDAAVKGSSELLANAQASDPTTRAEALHQIQAMGINLSDVLSQAHLGAEFGPQARAARLADEIVALEKRRREVLRDYAALTKIRPIEAEVIEG